jgi:hypothetical protein
VANEIEAQNQALVSDSGTVFEHLGNYFLTSPFACRQRNPEVVIAKDSIPATTLIYV